MFSEEEKLQQIIGANRSVLSDLKIKVRQLLYDRLIAQCVLPDPRLPSPVPEILDYLARNPYARGSIEDILQWWVLDAALRKWAPQIPDAVAKLVELDFLEEKRSADGGKFYHASARFLCALQQSAQ